MHVLPRLYGLAFGIVLLLGPVFGATAFGSEQLLVASPRGWYSGTNDVERGRWASVTARITNDQPHDRTLRVLVRFPAPDDAGQIRFSRLVTVPARTTMEVPVWVRVPERLRGERTELMSNIPAQVELYERPAGGSEVRIAVEQVFLPETRLIMPVVGLGSRFEDEESALTRSLIRRLRDRQFPLAMERNYRRPEQRSRLDELARTIVALPSRSVPTDAALLDSVGLVVVMSTPDDLSEAQMEALRRRLIAGGRMWVQLDRVDSAWVERLLGDSASIAVLDRPVLDRLILESSRSTWEVRSDQPVAMVHVVADGFEVRHRVGSRPASLTRQVGDGRLLLTTLAAEGWPDLGDGVEEQDRPLICGGRAAVRLLAGQAVSPLSELADWVYQGDIVTPGVRAMAARDRENREATMAQVSESRIGYSVVSRGIVGGLLVVFVAGLGVIGVISFRRSRGEMLAVMGPAVGVLVGVVMLGFGFAARQSAPLTGSATWLMRVSEDGLVYRAEGVAAMYAPTVTARRPASGREVEMWPAGMASDGAGLAGGDLWMTERGDRAWASVEVSPGRSVLASGEWSGVLGHPVVAMMQLEQGFVRLQMLGFGGSSVEDAVLFGGHGWLPVRAEGEAGWRLEADAALPPPGQYVLAAQLTETQRQRQVLMGELTYGPERLGVEGLRLAFWEATESLPLGRLIRPDGVDDADDPVVNRGGALWEVPVRVIRPAEGAEVSLPWYLWRVEPRPVTQIQAEGRRLNASNLDAQVWEYGRFVRDRRSGGWAVLAFSLPEELVPLTLDQLRFDLELEALGREVRLLVRQGERFVPVVFSRTVSRLEAELSGQVLRRSGVEQTGVLEVAIEVGPVPGDGERGTWWMDHPRLRAEARFVMPAAVAAP